MNLSKRQLELLIRIARNRNEVAHKQFKFAAADERIASRLFTLCMIEGLLSGGYHLTPLGVRTAIHNGWDHLS